MSDRVPSRIELEELRKRVARLRRQEEIKKKCGIALYEPHRKQDAFHRAGAFKRRYVRTGNRFGKSTCGVCEDVVWLLGYRPWYEENDPARYAGIPEHSVKGLVIVADWDKVEEIFTCTDEGAARGKLFVYLPEDSVVSGGIERNQSGKICKVRVRSIWGGESAIHFDTVKSYASNKMGHESGDWDFIHVDEPCPKGMWEAQSRGLVDRDGSAWFMCTPLNEPWINEYFFPDGNTRDYSDIPYEDPQLSKWVIFGSMHDNAMLKESAKALFISSLSDEDRQTRIDGRPRHLTGTIYKEFKPDVHILRALPPDWLAFNSPPPHYTIRAAADTHPKNPHAVLFAATAPSGRTYFFDELYEALLIPALTKEINSRLGGRMPLRFLLELAAYNDIPTDGVTIADYFISASIPIEAATKDLSFGIMKVKEALEARLPGASLPLLVFSPHLRRCFYEFENYTWNPETGKPRDQHDHMMENLYRLILTGLEYVEPTEYVAPVTAPINFNRLVLDLPDLPTFALPGEAQRRTDRKKDRVRSGISPDQSIRLRNKNLALNEEDEDQEFAIRMEQALKDQRRTSLLRHQGDRR